MYAGEEKVVLSWNKLRGKVDIRNKTSKRGLLSTEILLLREIRFPSAYKEQMRNPVTLKD